MMDVRLPIERNTMTDQPAHLLGGHAILKEMLCSG